MQAEIVLPGKDVSLEQNNFLDKFIIMNWKEHFLIYQMHNNNGL